MTPACALPADVPVEIIEHLPPELTGPQADQYDILGTKTTYRLAQRAASYVVLKVERPVFRRKGSDKPVTTPAPFNVLDSSLADVSLLVGLLVDKFQLHLPLYRQHQRIQQAGITVSRSTLTNLVKRAIDLLRPIVDAQSDNVLRSRVLAMDETPIKAGHQGRAGPQKGKMKSGWFWPLYGDADEVVFTYSNSRGRAHIEQVLNDQFSGTLISDGYAAYALLPSDPLTKALNYVLSREASLMVFLENPDVQPDTNHLERALRPIPMGKKNWMFCWTELGAEHLGIIQSLITTCKLHGLNPYTYLVDVLQRISQHPASDVVDLTPRLWKTRFAGHPLRSLIYPRHPERQSQQLEATVHAH